MELREFFTEKEIEEMKQKIILRVSSFAFLDEKGGMDEDGKYIYRQLSNSVNAAVKKQVDEIMVEFTREIINTVVKDRVATAAESFVTNLVDQLEKITNKTNWYWSIK